MQGCRLADTNGIRIEAYLTAGQVAANFKIYGLDIIINKCSNYNSNNTSWIKEFKNQKTFF